MKTIVEELNFGEEIVKADNEKDNAEKNMRDRVSNKIRSFSEKYSVRHTITRGVYTPTSQDDRISQNLIHYRENNGLISPFFGVFSNRWCYCGCGAGGLSIAVLDLENRDALREVVKKVRIASFRPEQAWIEIDKSYKHFTAKNKLFEIETIRHGVNGERSSPIGGKLSGRDISYPLGLMLINMLK
ncbi:MAG: hypothetical protein AABX07_03395 [Nanoarchaeota archaeon]